MVIPPLKCANCEDDIQVSHEHFVRVTTALRIEELTLCPACVAILLGELGQIREDDDGAR